MCHPPGTMQKFCGEGALWEAWAGHQLLASLTGGFGAVKEYLECASCDHCGLLHMPDLYSASHQLSKSGGVVSGCWSLSCFSCLNSSTDSQPTCFCSAGYTGNGTHCSGVSSWNKGHQVVRGKVTQMLFLSAMHHELCHALLEMFSSPELYTGWSWCC